MFMFAGQLTQSGLHSDTHNPFHLLHYVIKHPSLIVCAQILAQRAHRTEIVGLGVVGAVLLQGMIGEMDIVVGK